MAFVATDGKTRKIVQRADQALDLKKMGFKVFSQDMFAPTDFSEQELRDLAAKGPETPSRPIQPRPDVSGQTAATQLAAAPQSINVNVNIAPEQLQAASHQPQEQQTFLKKYWLHILIGIAIIVLLYVVGRIVWPMFVEAGGNIASVPGMV